MTLALFYTGDESSFASRLFASFILIVGSLAVYFGMWLIVQTDVFFEDKTQHWPRFLRRLLGIGSLANAVRKDQPEAKDARD